MMTHRALRLCAAGALLAAASAGASTADCPPATVAAMQGLTLVYPQQFELAEFESAANTMTRQQRLVNVGFGVISGRVAPLRRARQVGAEHVRLVFVATS